MKQARATNSPRVPHVGMLSGKHRTHTGYQGYGILPETASAWHMQLRSQDSPGAVGWPEKRLEFPPDDIEP